MSAAKMNHWDRLRAAMNGEAVDHVPISLWRHWAVDDETPEGLAAVMVNWQRTYDFDLVKLMPTGTYSIEDWGAETEYHANYRGIRTITKFGLDNAEMWPELAQLEVTKGYLGKQIQALRLTAAALNNEAPILQTIFSPLTTARKLAGERIFTDMRRQPELFKAGLQIIAETTARFAVESMNAGAHGMFFASQCDSYQLMSEAEYQEFGVQYDLQVMAPVKEAEFNMIHAHGEDIMFDLMASYPARMMNWHDRLTWPNLSQAAERYNGLSVGGVNEWHTLLYGPEEAIKAEVREAIAQTGGRRLMIGPGCVIPSHTPARHVRAAIEAVTSAG